MQAKVKTIKDFTTGNSIYPVTKADAVYMANSTKTVQGVLGDTNISGIGDGTLTGAVNDVNNQLSSLPNLQSGYFEVTVPANSYVEYPFAFPVAYSYIPSLVCTPVVYSDPKSFSVVLRGRFQGSGTLRIGNTASSQTTVGINWIAF